MLLYINQPCVVVGRNQSIYREVNFDYLKNGSGKICRRITGGGTVYQDEGNLCFSFVESAANHKTGNYLYFNQCIIDILKSVGYDVVADKRNNLLFSGKKISGNAQFTNRRNIISHGTLLYNSNLENLRTALRENSFEVETKAVASVRSSVMNLNQAAGYFADAMEIQKFLIGKLPITSIRELSKEERSEIEKLAQHFESTEWIYGRSPNTILRYKNTEVCIMQGRIEQLKINGRIEPEWEKVPFTYKDITMAMEIKKVNEHPLLQLFKTTP